MNRILDRQLLMQEFSGYDSIPEFEAYLAVAPAYSMTENAVSVLSDLKERTSHIFYGGFGQTLGIAGKGTVHRLKTIGKRRFCAGFLPRTWSASSLRN